MLEKMPRIRINVEMYARPLTNGKDGGDGGRWSSNNGINVGHRPSCEAYKRVAATPKRVMLFNEERKEEKKEKGSAVAEQGEE